MLELTDMQDKGRMHNNNYDEEADYRQTEQKLIGGSKGPEKRHGYQDDVEMSYGINADDGNRTDELEFVDDNTHDSGEESLIPNKKVSRIQHYPDL